MWQKLFSKPFKKMQQAPPPTLSNKNKKPQLELRTYKDGNFYAF
jgi:hypothetical protein